MEAARTLVATLCPSEMQRISASINTPRADAQTRHGTPRGAAVVTATYTGRQSTPEPRDHGRDHLRSPDKPAALPGRKATATAGSPPLTRAASPGCVSSPQSHLSPHAEAIRCLAALQAQLEHAIDGGGALRCASPGAVLQPQQWPLSLGPPPRLPAPVRQAPYSARGTGEESAAVSSLAASAERERAWVTAGAHAEAVAEAIRIRREASL